MTRLYLTDADSRLVEAIQVEYPNHGLAGGVQHVTIGRQVYDNDATGEWHRMGTLERLAHRELGDIHTRSST